MPNVVGAMGVAGGEFARYAITYHSILGLKVPNGTAMIPARGSVISENRNGIAEEAMKMGAEWVFYMDDDQVFAPDTLTRLLAHNLDIVSGLYVSREAPFIPHAYDAEDERGWCTFRPLKKGDAGLCEVKSVGAGCMLVRRNVFEAMPRPWWRLGQITMDGWGDDHNFCHRAREAGFKVWVDLEIVVGHQMNGTLWPRRGEDGKWNTVLVQSAKTGPIVSWPAATRQ